MAAPYTKATGTQVLAGYGKQARQGPANYNGKGLIPPQQKQQRVMGQPPVPGLAQMVGGRQAMANQMPAPAQPNARPAQVPNRAFAQSGQQYRAGQQAQAPRALPLAMPPVQISPTGGFTGGPVPGALPAPAGAQPTMGKTPNISWPGNSGGFTRGPLMGEKPAAAGVQPTMGANVPMAAPPGGGMQQIPGPGSLAGMMHGSGGQSGLQPVDQGTRTQGVAQATIATGGNSGSMDTTGNPLVDAALELASGGAWNSERNDGPDGGGAPGPFSGGGPGGGGPGGGGPGGGGPGGGGPGGGGPGGGGGGTKIGQIISDLAGKAGDDLGVISEAMTEADLESAKNAYDDFSRLNDQDRIANDMYRSGSREAAEAAARESLYQGVNSQRDDALRMQEGRAARGGAVGSGGNIGIWNAANQAIAEGERGLTQDKFGRDMAATQQLLDTLSGTTDRRYGIIGDEKTSRKELLSMLLEAGNPLAALFPD